MRIRKFLKLNGSDAGQKFLQMKVVLHCLIHCERDKEKVRNSNIL